MDQFMDDTESLLKEARLSNFDTPLFLYAQSTGGTIVSNYLIQRNPQEVRGAILSSPWLDLAFEPPKSKVRLAKIGGRLFPSLTQDNELNASHLSHDQHVVEAYNQDPLVHRKISARLFLDCYHGGKYAIEHAQRITVPTLIMHGSEDKITSFEASRKFSAQHPEMISFIPFDGQFHELHNESVQIAVFDTILEFLHKHTA
jgi:alpha-beta hydrolase superfamily lysophospholipase